MQSNSKTPSPPFTCVYSPNLPELLNGLNCTLAISTYQAGKLILLSATDNNKLTQLPRQFDKPMGIGIRENGHQIAIASKDCITTFTNSPDLAKHFPRKPDTYDSLYMPRVSFHTSTVDIHDLCWTSSELFAVNTLFSCIVKLDDQYNFIPVWKPDWIDELVSEDRCHLNGMCVADNEPAFATSFNAGNSFQSWKTNLPEGGVLINIRDDKVVLENLSMPHSPRYYKDKVYLLLSATGELISYDPKTSVKETINHIDGFARGMSIYHDYAFIGVSKLRQNSSSFGHLPISGKTNKAGICVIHLATGSICGWIHYEASVDEIYEVAVIPDVKRANILNVSDPLSNGGISIPGATYWATEIKK